MAEQSKSVFKLSGTRHRRATAYHPQMKGLTERLNKTIADMLCMHVEVERKNWDEIIPYVILLHNTAQQDTTRKIQFRLLHGRGATPMLDAMLLSTDEDEGDRDAEEFTRRAHESRQLARERIALRQDYDAIRYNLRHRHVLYEWGDKVWICTPVRCRGLSEKQLRRYFGSYIVLRRLNDVSYEVAPADSSRSKRRQQQADVVHMKPYSFE